MKVKVKVKVRFPRNDHAGPEGIRGMLSSFSNLGTRRKFMVNATLQPLYPRL